MTVLSDTKARIESEVSALAGSLQEAVDLAELINENQLPQRSIAGFVTPAGLDGREPDAVTGMFRQNYDDALAVVLVLQAPGDPSAKRALPTLDQLIDDVLAAVCGWSPGTELNAQFKVRRGRMLAMKAGAVWYQLDFILQRQLRIAS